MESKKKQHVVVESGITTINLKHPIKLDETDIKKIDLDFNKVTGEVLCAAEVESQARFFNSAAEIEFGKGYQASVAAKISGLPYDTILNLKHSDLKIVSEVVKGFLIS